MHTSNASLAEPISIGPRAWRAQMRPTRVELDIPEHVGAVDCTAPSTQSPCAPAPTPNFVPFSPGLAWLALLVGIIATIALWTTRP